MVTLTDREYKVVSIIWSEGRGLTSEEIYTLFPNSALKQSALHPTINGLLKKDMIYVESMVQSGRTYARIFNTTMTMEEYHSRQIKDEHSYMREKEKKLPGLFAALIDDDDIHQDTLAKLEKLIEERKKELE